MSPREKQAKQLADNLSSAIFELIMFTEESGPKEARLTQKDVAGLAGRTTTQVGRWIKDGKLIGEKISPRIYEIKWSDWERFALARGFDPDGNNQ